MSKNKDNATYKRGDNTISLFTTNADSFLTLHEPFCKPITLALMLAKDAINNTISDIVGPDYGMSRELALSLAYTNLYATDCRDIPF